MENFELKETFTPFVSGSNLSSLSVGDRLPRKVVWSFNEVEFTIECLDGLVAKNSQSNIFVIEAPYQVKKNRAYILSPDNHLVADLPKTLDGALCSYYDILNVDSRVIFLASCNSRDFQLQIDPVTGAVISIKGFR